MIRTSLSRSLSAAALLAALGACTGGERAQSGTCPAGETCSPFTPKGLHFLGTQVSGQELEHLFGPAPTAVGGTQDIWLEYDPGDGELVPLDLPYEADDDGGRGIEVVTTSGPVVTVRGVDSRSNYLRIVDPDTSELYDRYELTGAAIERIALVGTEYEKLPSSGPDIVWATGDQEIGVGLFGEAQVGSSPSVMRLVDTSMVLTLSGSERTAWDSVRLANAQVGTYPLTVTAGDRPAATFDVEIVDGATEIVSLSGQMPTIPANSSDNVCFAAMNDGRYVYGLTWTFVVDGHTTVQGKDDLTRNCVRVSDLGLSETITVEASAGGQSLTVTARVGLSARVPGDANTPSRSAVRSEAAAGERARLAAGR